MRKLIACIAALAALGLLAGPASAEALPVKASLKGCHTGSEPLDRYAFFVAQMGTISGATKSQLRFDLYQRAPGAGDFKVVAAPGLGVWRSSTDDTFKYTKQVTALVAGDEYRAVVRFRWVGPKGILKTTRRTTAVCRQADPGPDLAVGSIKAQSTGAGRAQYSVTIRNDGRTDAGVFDVALTIGTALQPHETVESLSAESSTVVTFVGPKCAPGDRISVQVDPDQRIPQTDRTDDARTVACPVSGR